MNFALKRKGVRGGSEGWISGRWKLAVRSGRTVRRRRSSVSGLRMLANQIEIEFPLIIGRSVVTRFPGILSELGRRACSRSLARERAR